MVLYINEFFICVVVVVTYLWLNSYVSLLMKYNNVVINVYFILFNKTAYIDWINDNCKRFIFGSFLPSYKFLSNWSIFNFVTFLYSNSKWVNHCLSQTSSWYCNSYLINFASYTSDRNGLTYHKSYTILCLGAGGDMYVDSVS